MQIKVAYTTEKTADAAVNHIKKELSGAEPKAVIYFASAQYEGASLAQNMAGAFARTVTFGCTTSGEIVSGKMLDHSLVAMALDKELVADIRVEILQDVNRDAKGAVAKAFQAFETHYKTPMSALDLEKYVGIILVDGLSGAEEKIMDQIGNRTNIHFVGGSAGDDLQFKKTQVFGNGKAHSNAAILALIKAGRPFEILKTQSFKPLKQIFTATKVNEAKREVLEFNHKPAVAVYAESLQTTPDRAAEFFMRNPVGLMVGDEPYVRSPQRIEGNSMHFYCNIVEGMELNLLESTDIVQDTAAAVKALGPVAGIINFHCILRTLELKSKQQDGDYGRIFQNIPTVGFSTYGEEYLGHINQTSTMLVFR